jgi:endonuclease/exonuclease/phosphatase (EEP) superfamily protein YafD
MFFINASKIVYAGFRYKIILLTALALSACIRIPDESLIVSQRGDISTIQDDCDCETARFEKTLEPQNVKRPELDSSGFRLMNWNMQKGMKDGWEEDFENLIQESDILTVQEAYLNDALRELLKKGRYCWDISNAFQYKGREVGVLTASRLDPDFICTFRVKEPLINIPKTVIVTIYPLSGTDKSLLVVNIHSINFTVDTRQFDSQLHEVERILSQHQGPLIVSGDINTWSKKRTTIVENLFNRVGLTALTFEKDYRVKIFGRDVDHIFYRGLTASASTVLKVKSSDHNPMLVTFRLAESG